MLPLLSRAFLFRAMIVETSKEKKKAIQEVFIIHTCFQVILWSPFVFGSLIIALCFRS